MTNDTRTYLRFSIVISVMVLFSSLIGVITPRIYDQNAFEWEIQSVWQDIANLVLIIPLLTVSGIAASKEKKPFIFVWAGTILYVFYAYTIYCFSVHFNQLFLLYCTILGLSVFALLWFLFIRAQGHGMYTSITGKRPVIMPVYLILLGAGFYLLWLTDIVPPTLKNTIPPKLVQLDLPTNPVEVLDLSLMLPLFILSGVLVLRRKGLGMMMSQIILIFAALMSITIGSLQLLLYFRHLDARISFAIVMLLLGVLDIILFTKTIPSKDHNSVQQSVQRWNFG